MAAGDLNAPRSPSLVRTTTDSNSQLQGHTARSRQKRTPSGCDARVCRRRAVRGFYFILSCTFTYVCLPGSRGGRGNAASDNDSAGSPGGTWGASGPPSPASSTFSGLSNGKDVSGELRDAFVRHRQPCVAVSPSHGHKTLTIPYSINVRSLGSTNWGFRRAREVQNWSEQLGPLVDTYLEYRHTAAAAGAPAPTLFEKYSSDAHVLASPVRGHVQLVDISGETWCLPRCDV